MTAPACRGGAACSAGPQGLRPACAAAHQHRRGAPAWEDAADMAGGVKGSNLWGFGYSAAPQDTLWVPTVGLSTTKPGRRRKGSGWHWPSDPMDGLGWAAIGWVEIGWAAIGWVEIGWLEIPVGWAGLGCDGVDMGSAARG
jgi:hypothetical protein